MRGGVGGGGGGGGVGVGEVSRERKANRFVLIERGATKVYSNAG